MRGYFYVSNPIVLLKMDALSPEDICYRILRTIAEAEEVSCNDLPPLGESIDIEAVGEFLESSSGSAKAEFEYMDWRIKLTANGRITIIESKSEQNRYVARCNTCEEKKRDVRLEAAQDFFATHADRSHAVEIHRSDGVEPNPSEDTFGSETGQAEGTD